MMKLPIVNSNSDISESLIKHLTDPACLEQYESLMPGWTQRLLKEAEKQLSHNRKRYWARLIVTLILGVFAIHKLPAEILHTLMGGL